ncbi:hypothetical protein SCHPADRAFT_937912 [Schizopora paradoxa]|uniref:F-box domain-containing protein n=1 Tax=Schizopora paradoxa TaxID=27342 RepID=A0A0H2RXX3_9AGAM|nr:hypothetical protein SCHPADRAFT_937912 [Schizopora paradoxa]
MALQETICQVEEAHSDAPQISQVLSDHAGSADRSTSHSADDLRSPQAPAAKALSTLEALPREIHEHIFSFALSLASLHSMASTCTVLWASFQERKRFILKLVIVNEAGPALTYVLALSRIIKNREEADSIHNINDKSSWYWSAETREDEYQYIVEVSSVLRELEIEFSSHPLEIKIPEFNGDNARRDDEMQKYTTLITDLNRKETKEYELVNKFLTDIQKHTDVGVFRSFREQPTTRRSFLHSPYDVLFEYRRTTSKPRALSRTSSMRPNNFMVWRIRDSLSNLLRKWGLEHVAYVSAIIDSVEDDHVSKCQSCQCRTTWLFSDDNWDKLDEVFPPEGLVFFLPGDLSFNFTVLQDLKSIISTSSNTFYPRMMDEIFRWFIENKKLLVESSLKYVRRNHWICGDCVKKIFQEHSFDWMVRRSPTKDVEVLVCPLGFSCAKQALYDTHAASFNHMRYPDAKKLPDAIRYIDDVVGIAWGNGP